MRCSAAKANAMVKHADQLQFQPTYEKQRVSMGLRCVWIFICSSDVETPSDTPSTISSMYGISKKKIRHQALDIWEANVIQRIY
jgi:hypothetical protein